MAETRLGIVDALLRHWPEYVIEAAGLGTFMISAGVFDTLLEYPQSPVHHAIADPLARRALMGLAMGLTLVALVYSPWGKQSGAHFNPVVTLTFFRLGKLAPADALFYGVAQFAGGLLGVLLVWLVLGQAFAVAPVEFAITIPGPAGTLVAFFAEVAISFGLMLAVLYTSNRVALMRYTGVVAALLLAAFITFESPLSGASLNPARTIASALPSGKWTGAWIYFAGPLLGMWASVEAYQAITGRSDVMCAKLNHETHRRCIFRDCEFKRHGIDVPKLLAERHSTDASFNE